MRIYLGTFYVVVPSQFGNLEIETCFFVLIGSEDATVLWQDGQRGSLPRSISGRLTGLLGICNFSLHLVVGEAKQTLGWGLDVAEFTPSVAIDGH